MQRASFLNDGTESPFTTRALIPDNEAMSQSQAPKETDEYPSTSDPYQSKTAETNHPSYLPNEQSLSSPGSAITTLSVPSWSQTPPYRSTAQPTNYYPPPQWPLGTTSPYGQQQPGTNSAQVTMPDVYSKPGTRPITKPQYAQLSGIAQSQSQSPNPYRANGPQTQASQQVPNYGPTPTYVVNGQYGEFPTQPQGNGMYASQTGLVQQQYYVCPPPMQNVCPPPAQNMWAPPAQAQSFQPYAHQSGQSWGQQS